MTTDDQIRDEKYNMILIAKRQMYQPYHQAKLIIINTLQVNKYCLLVKNK